MEKKIKEITREDIILSLEKSGLLPPEGGEPNKKNKGRRSNGEGSWSYEERKNGKYWKYTIYLGKQTDGKRITKSFGAYKKSEALNKANEYRLKFLKGYTSSKTTLEEYYEDWLYNFKFKEVAGSTAVNYDLVFRKRLKGTTLGATRLGELTLPLLQSHFNTLALSLSSIALKKTRMTLNACLDKAQLEGLINRNYCKAVKIKKETRKQGIKPMTKEEQKLFEENLNFNLVHHQLFYFILYTGLRRGEALALEWSDIKGNEVTVNKQYSSTPKKMDVGSVGGYNLIVKKTKTGASDRKVPLPKPLMALLDKMREGMTSDLLFSKQGEHLNPTSASRICAQLFKKLGIEGKGIHSLRHTYATRLFELKIEPKTIQALLGHSNIVTTLNVYTCVLPDQKTEAVNKLDNLF